MTFPTLRSWGHRGRSHQTAHQAGKEILSLISGDGRTHEFVINGIKESYRQTTRQWSRKALGEDIETLLDNCDLLSTAPAFQYICTRSSSPPECIYTGNIHRSGGILQDHRTYEAQPTGLLSQRSQSCHHSIFTFHSSPPPKIINFSQLHGIPSRQHQTGTIFHKDPDPT